MSIKNTLFPINFSNTTMGDIWKCELYFFRRHCQKLVNNTYKSSDLIAGGNFAKGCELVRKAYFNEGKSEEDAIEIGCKHILESEDTGDSNKSNERLSFTLKKYFERFPLDSLLTPVKLTNGEHAIEYEFAFDLGIPHPEIPNQNLIFKGKLDGLYERNIMGKRVGVYVVDEKTTGGLSRIKGTKTVDIVREEAPYRTDSQLIAYCWASKQLGIVPEGALIRKVPILSKHEDSFEIEIKVNDFMIEQWSTTTFNKIHELVDKYMYYKENGVAQQSFYPSYSHNACNSYARQCTYAQGCMSEHGEAILQSDMKQVMWLSDEKREVSLTEYKQKLGIK